MNYREGHRLEHAVAAICPDIKKRVALNRPALTERQLWWELCCCVLSSQVPYDLAVAAADAVDASGIMLNSRQSPALATNLSLILSNSVTMDGKHRTYRFPVARANQLAETRTAVTQQAGNLKALLANFSDAAEARIWFVSNAPGLGPKQASMFLRNAGQSYDLAILDRHVLNYMATLGLSEKSKHFITGLPQYRQYEEKLRSHAERLGFAVGLLDWAIWIVMRVEDNPNMELEFV